MSSPRPKAAVVVGVVCAAVLAARLPVRAQVPAAAPALAVALEYVALDACPDVGDFKAIVVERLGYDPFRDGAAEHVVVQIAERAPAFEGHIEWRDAQGKWVGDRTFPSRSDDCHELARAMAFALALQIQVWASTADSPAPPTAPAAAAPAPPAPALSESHEVTTAPPSTPASAQPRSPVLSAGVAGLIGFGMSSRPVPLGRLTGSLAWPHWALELAAEAGWPAKVRRADGAGFSQQPLLLGFAGCGLLPPWKACLVAKAGAIRIAGQDIDVAAAPWGPLVETGIRVAALATLGRHVYVGAELEGLLVVTRWRVDLDNTQVWRSSRFAETVGLAAGVRFP